LPVFSLALLLGQPQAEDRRIQQIIAFHTAGSPWALLVDRVTQMGRSSQLAVWPSPALAQPSDGSPFTGVVQLAGDMLLLLAPERLRPGTMTPVPQAPRWNDPAPGLTLPVALGTAELIIFAADEPAPRQRPVKFGLSAAQVLEILGPSPSCRSRTRRTTSWVSWPGATGPWPLWTSGAGSVKPGAQRPRPAAS